MTNAARDITTSLKGNEAEVWMQSTEPDLHFSMMKKKDKPMKNVGK